MINFSFQLVSLLSLGLVAQTIQATEPVDRKIHYHLLAQIPIKGQGGWDALTADPGSHRLYVSHSDRVVVIDTEKNSVLKEILDTPGVHAIALAPELKKGFSSNGKENKVSVIDLETLTTKNKISVGENPDLIIYDPESFEVYAFNGRGQSASVLDAKTETVVATIQLPGKPEFAALDISTHRLFVNIEDKNLVLVIDSQTHKIKESFKISGCESPSGLALDASNHRLFVACENAKMVMMDAQNGRTVASVPTGEGSDGAAFDSSLRLAFIPNGKSGTLTIAHEVTQDHIAVLENLKTQVGARTLALDSKSHRIYLPTADFKPTENGGRPKPIDGSQRVLVYAP